MIQRFLACVIALFAFAGASAAQTPPAQAPVERYALVVGVSGYTGGIPALNGPKNDASMITTLLREQGVPRANIRVLADSMDTAVRPVATDGLPTRAAILAGFRWLAERGGPNTEILIFMAGHGTQIAAPARGNEPDGMTEVFLPLNATARATQAATGALSFAETRNLLTDDNINDAIAPILATGARVWLVVDACHSGTLSRSAGDDSVARDVDPAIFGAAATTAPAAAAGTPAPPRRFRFQRFRDQRFTAFYAAHPYQRAYESTQPRNAQPALGAAARPPQKFGEMTWSLVQALRNGESATYRTVAQRVLAGVWQLSGNRQTPMFEGAMNERPMLGAGSQRVIALTMQNGSLMLASGWTEDITVGSTYAIVDSGDPSRVLGSATVDQVGATTSRLVVAAGADPRVGDADAQSVVRLSARLRQRAVPFVLSVARPQLLPGVTATQADRDLVARVNQQLQTLANRAVAEQPIAFELALPNGAADLYPYVARDRLYFFQPGVPVELPQEPGAAPYSLEGSFVRSARGETEVGQVLWRLGRARNLRRVATTVGDSEISRDLRVRVLTEPGDGRPATAPCDDGLWRLVPAAPASATAADYETEPPTVRHCDMVYLEVRNAGPVTLSVGVMYIDPWSQIYSAVPDNTTEPQAGVLRLAAGARRVIAYPEDLAPDMEPDLAEEDRVPVKAEGLVNLLVLAVPVTPGVDPPTFEYLRQGHTQQVMRSAAPPPPTPFHGLLQSAGLVGPTLRNANSAGRAERGGAVIVPIFTQSRR